VKEGRLKDLDVYVDSPLADRATKIYMAHPEFFDAEAVNTFKFRSSAGMRIHFTTTIEESQKINRIKSGAIIIAGSGMCEGGRIRHHFKHNIWRQECSIIFTGFQVPGTLGRYIVDGAKRAYILGEEMAIRARVYTIGGFSAHADQRELLSAGPSEHLGFYRPRRGTVAGVEKMGEKLGLTTNVCAPSEGTCAQTRIGGKAAGSENVEGTGFSLQQRISNYRIVAARCANER
jgi:hypothetical protein